MKVKHFAIGFLALILAACGTANDDASTNGDEQSDEIEMIEVAISTASEELQPNEAFTVQAHVTLGDENVNDAEEVEFEFWKKGQTENHDMIEGTFTEEGIYEMEKTVEEPGIYYVTSHVTARGMHNMPTKELQIGDVSEASEDEHAHEEEHDHGSEDGHGDHADHGDSEGRDDHGHGGHGDMVNAHIMVDDTVKANEEVSLMSHLQKEDQPLTEADVRFEIWKDGAEKHEYVDATENAEGEYMAKHTFSEKGSYHVKLHYKKGDFHDHKEKTITVE